MNMLTSGEEESGGEGQMNISCGGKFLSVPVLLKSFFKCFTIFICIIIMRKGVPEKG